MEAATDKTGKPCISAWRAAAVVRSPVPSLTSALEEIT